MSVVTPNSAPHGQVRPRSRRAASGPIEIETDDGLRLGVWFIPAARDELNRLTYAGVVHPQR